MSFLDNLENNLKSLESREESSDAKEAQRRQRDRDRAETQAAAPYAEQLKKSAFTSDLLKHAARVGFEKRTKVHVAWLGSSLRLEARERRVELRPTGSGIRAIYVDDGQEVRNEPLDLDSSAEAFIRAWLI